MKNSDRSSRRYEELSHQISAQREPSGPRAMVTKDHDLIRRWAERRGAVPATGEATASGPATMKVNDGGAGIRFNFPGLHPSGPFRGMNGSRISMYHDLEFVYEEEVADRPASSGKRGAASLGGIAKIGSRRKGSYEGPRAPHSGDTGSSSASRRYLLKARCPTTTGSGASRC